MVSRGLLSPVNPGRKPSKFAFADLKKLFANHVEDKKALLDYTILEFTSPFFNKRRCFLIARKISSGSFNATLTKKASMKSILGITKTILSIVLPMIDSTSCYLETEGD